MDVVEDLKFKWVAADPNVDVSFKYTNFTKIREEHKVCMDISVTAKKSKLNSNTAVAIGFATLSPEPESKEIDGVEAVTLFMGKNKKVKTAGAWYPDIKLADFNDSKFAPMAEGYVNENIWTLSKGVTSKDGKKMKGTLCREYSAKRSWKYRVPRKTAVSV